MHMTVHRWPAVGLTALLVMSSLPSPGFSATTWPLCGAGTRITCVVDGDTLWSEGVKYRIVDIDAPETADKAHCDREIDLAMQATDLLQTLLESGGVSFQTFGTDRYGRLLVKVRTNRGDVSTEMMNAGLATPFKRGPYDRQRWCKTSS